MKLPELMPARPSQMYEVGPVSTAQPTVGDAIEPACLVKICVDTPFGQVCHCAA